MKFVFRMIGLFLLVLAVVAATIDAATSVANSKVMLTPFGDAFVQFGEKTFFIIKKFTEETLHPFLWDPVLIWFFLQPSFAVLAVFSLIFYLLGSKRKKRKKSLSF